MAGMFIDVEVDARIAADAALAKKLTEVCPVNIFEQAEGGALRKELREIHTWQEQVARVFRPGKRIAQHCCEHLRGSLRWGSI